MDQTAPLTIFQFTSASQLGYGAARSMLTLGSALQKRGHRLVYGTIAHRGLAEVLEGRGLETVEFQNRVKLDPTLILALKRFLVERKVHVLHAHLNTSALNGIIAARLARIPSIATVHGMSFKVPYCFATRTIAVSEACRSHMVGQKVSPERVSTVYNGLDLSAFESLQRDPQMKLQFGFPSDSFVVGTTSRATQLKGIPIALEALAKKRETMPHLRYLFVGGGGELDALQSLAREFKIEDRVTFTDYLEDVRPALQAMDLFAFPSLKEAMGISLVEAMATGLPVVSTTVGGIPEVVQNGATGLLVAPGDADALANAIEVFARDRDLCSKMGAKGRERVQEHFTAEAMGATMEKVYRETIAAFGAPQRATAPA